MTKTKQEIIQEIKSFINKYGGTYTAWYVGIAANPRSRLFNDHKVDEKNDLWIYRQANNSNEARETEDYFVNILGTDGDTGGGDNNTDYVYAYKKTSTTVE